MGRPRPHRQPVRTNRRQQMRRLKWRRTPGRARDIALLLAEVRGTRKKLRGGGSAGTGTGSGNTSSGAGTGGTGTGKGRGTAGKGAGATAGRGAGTGSGAGSGQGTGSFPGITIQGGENNPGNPGDQPVFTNEPQTSYGMTVVSTASSGGGLEDFGVFENERIFTVYIPVKPTPEEADPTWT